MNFKRLVAEHIEKYRKTRGVSKHQAMVAIANRFEPKCTYKTIEYWIKGTNFPTENHLSELAKALSLNSSELDELTIERDKAKSNSQETASAYHLKSMVDLVWNNLFSHDRLAGKLKLEMVEGTDARSLEEIATVLQSLLPSMVWQDLQEIIKAAHKKACDQKYGEMYEDVSKDERANSESKKPFKDWQTEFRKQIDGGLSNDKMKTLHALILGSNSAREGRGLYEKFEKLILIDLSANALERADEYFKHLFDSPHKYKSISASAESLDQYFNEKVDIIIALRLFQSSYLDVETVVTQCFRALAPGGKLIASIPNQYKNQHGLSRTRFAPGRENQTAGYSEADLRLPIDLVRRLCNAIMSRAFQNLKLSTGKTEYYVVATKPLPTD